MQANEYEFKLTYSEKAIPNWCARFSIPEMSWGGWADTPLKAIDTMFTIMGTCSQKIKIGVQK